MNTRTILPAFLFSFCFAIISITTRAQSPGPDCGTAIDLGSIPQWVSSIVVDDFDPETYADPTCITPSGNFFINDGWYSFSNPANQNVTISGTTTDGVSDLVIELFITCGSTAIACENAMQYDGTQTETMVFSNLPAGTYYIRLSSYDFGTGGNMTLSALWITPITQNLTKLNNKELIFTISPNPLTSQTTISFDSKMKNTTIINISNVLGNIVKRQKAIGNSAVLDMSDVSKGIYFVQIGNTFRKIIKQ